MKKKALLKAAFVLVLLQSTVVLAQLDIFAQANFVFPPSNPVITIGSPTNKTYSKKALSLEVAFETYKTGYWGAPEERTLRLFTYSLDGKKPERITITYSSVARNPGGHVVFWGYARLPELSEGLHSLTVRVVFNYSDLNSPHNWDNIEHFNFHTESVSNVFFRIDTFTQNISILMPENRTYNPTEVPLQFSVDEPASSVGYSLDGEKNVTIRGNVTLPELSVGPHTLTLYANDTSGNPAASENINFTIAEPAPEPFQTTLVLEHIGILAIVGTGSLVGSVLLFYFKKRKQ